MLVKRYIPEVGSAGVTALWQSEPIAISLVTIPEIASTLARRTGEGSLTEQARDTLFRLFRRDAESFVVVDINRTVIQGAAGLLLTAPLPVRLRTLDALHVASAQWAFARGRRVTTGAFVTADRALADAASWAGPSIVIPEDYP